ncbi:MAG: ribosome-associated translation inhibitor RaiA [Phycisphaerales bacterium]|jgi:putative sigma-54 modulation protein|nr:ribosome-associated translation inhibitor RaiA [Phycisphaerales bacterium]
MVIQVIGKHMDVTEAIKAHAEKKASKLPKHFDRVQAIVIRLEQDPKGKGFHCEVICDVEKHADFIGNSHQPDLYNAIDEAVEKVDRQLGQYKDKLKGG